MSANDVAELIDSLSSLIGILIWPALIVFLVLRFRVQLGEAAEELRTTIRSREFSVKAGPGGLELTAGARAATALLEEAEATKPDGGADPVRVKAAVDSAVEIISAQSTGARRQRILWVDDRPENNRLERRALEELGVEVRTSTSTQEALEILRSDRFDVVISDMGRPPDRRAGYTLLDTLRERGNDVPFVIYAGSRAPEHVEEARHHGAVGATNRSSELIELVVRALA
jgi:CheY-like chemotaxis protein